MNQDSGDLESGEHFDESFDFKEITWKIPNALDFPDEVDYKIDGRPFPFAGAIWNLQLFPSGQSKYNSEEHIDLFIMRQSSRFIEQEVFYKFCFTTKDGKEFKSVADSVLFSSPLPSSHGICKFMPESEFEDMENELAPNDTLIVVCQMRIKRVEVLERYSQTESMASLSSCDCTSRQLSLLSAKQTLQDLKELFLKQEDCDVTLKVQEKEFKTHKAILVARSPVFASTFRSDMVEKSSGVVNIEDCDPSSFADFLCFLYCGKVENITTGNVYGLFKAADKYDVKTLRLECVEFMKRNLTIDTFCETVTLALQHLERELIDMSTDFYARHWQEIIVTVKWQNFVIRYPVQSNEIMIKALLPKK